MKTETYFGALELEKRNNRRLRWALAGALGTILIQAAAILAQAGQTIVTFVPPEISKPFWLSGEEASSDYFEQLGQFINGLPLNVTPETVQQSCSQYLVYMLPKDRDRHKKRCDFEAARVRRDGASQMFAVREIHTNEKTRRVVISGVLTTIISGKAFRSNESYAIEFAHSGGRFYVSNHVKVESK